MIRFQHGSGRPYVYQNILGRLLAPAGPPTFDIYIGLLHEVRYDWTLFNKKTCYRGMAGEGGGGGVPTDMSGTVLLPLII